MKLEELWDTFLTLQADLFFEKDITFYSNLKFWGDAENVLDMGCGNGVYHRKLAEAFPKKYVGMDKNPAPGFKQGDCEVLQEEFIGKFDVVLFRLVLQHLKNPLLAVEHAHKYLKKGGHVIIIDSYDPARASSHVIPSLDSMINSLGEYNRIHGTGNRFISMEILRSGLYPVVSSNLNKNGEIVGIQMKFDTPLNRRRYVTMMLLVFEILKIERGIPFDLKKAHDELQVYLQDETSWASIGLHYLIIRP